jgi:hypothetical protein
MKLWRIDLSTTAIVATPDDGDIDTATRVAENQLSEILFAQDLKPGLPSRVMNEISARCAGYTMHSLVFHDGDNDLSVQDVLQATDREGDA